MRNDVFHFKASIVAHPLARWFQDDRDPSDRWMLTALAERVTAFAGVEVEFVRTAVTSEQTERYQDLGTALAPPLEDAVRARSCRICRARFAGNSRTRGVWPLPAAPLACPRGGISLASRPHRDYDTPLGFTQQDTIGVHMPSMLEIG
ncbi:hypothetical protein [Kitasatospora sp. NPDC098663]|uniref:hypothetical protein n=1 Tax=Kitasatospora sp. NPDC098663 TaxID=3364096 RepID=UPI00381C65C1